MTVFIKYEVEFFTATILEWKNLLYPDKYKDIIVESLKYLVENGRVKVHAFVIMNNHIHILWQIIHPHMRKNIQRDFLKYTAQKIKFDLQKNHTDVLRIFEVKAKDRQYQFWERNPLSVEVYTPTVLHQKSNYIHENPVRAGLVDRATDYKYSSASFYEYGENVFGFLTQP